jgi:hypothetical protein
MLIIIGPLFASNVQYVRVPANNCHQILSATYSTGGGNSAFIYIKVFCKAKNGEESLFMENKMSGAGILGISRLTIPNQIKFIKDESLSNKIVLEAK